MTAVCMAYGKPITKANILFFFYRKAYKSCGRGRSKSVVKIFTSCGYAGKSIEVNLILSAGVADEK